MLQTIEKTRLSLVPLLKEYAIYNLWANKTIISWLRTKPLEIFEKEVISSFPSLRATLAHIRDTQQWWFENLQQLDPVFFAEKLSGETTEDLLDDLIEQSEEFADYVDSLDEYSLNEIGDFSIPYVGDYSCKKYEMIHHCMNHSTYHRGQLITIARNLGQTDPPMTDFMFYVLMARP